METEKKINITLTEGQKEVTVLHGTAKPHFKIRKPILIDGNIDVPLVHLSKKSLTQLDYVDWHELGGIIDQSYLRVNRDNMEISFIENAGKDFESQYTGRLILDLAFREFGINDNTKSYTPLQLSEKIKLFRSFFENKTEAMKLVSQLRDFEAKVNKEVEAKADERANRKVLFHQTVTTNIPEAFKIKLPIFKGHPPISFEVEIGIDPVNLNCVLLSPEANDLVLEGKNTIIDEQLLKIRELHPTLRIFEV